MESFFFDEEQISISSISIKKKIPSNRGITRNKNTVVSSKIISHLPEFHFPWQELTESSLAKINRKETKSHFRAETFSYDHSHMNANGISNFFSSLFSFGIDSVAKRIWEYGNEKKCHTYE